MQPAKNSFEFLCIRRVRRGTFLQLQERAADRQKMIVAFRIEIIHELRTGQTICSSCGHNFKVIRLSLPTSRAQLAREIRNSDVSENLTLRRKGPAGQGKTGRLAGG